MNIKNLFHRPEHFTAPDSALSPAEKASRKWDAREGEIIEQNYHLRKILLGLMGVICVLGAALAYKAISENVTVYVVETDIKTGEIRNVGTANSMENYKPDEQVYSYFVRQFVQDVRSIPLDEVVYKNQLREAYYFLTQDGANVLQSRFDDEKRAQKFGKATVQVTIQSIIPMDGGKSYQVRWSEVEYLINSKGGGDKNVSQYTGMFTVDLLRTKDKDILKYNPLGMYILDFRWEEDEIKKTDTSKDAAK